VLTGSSGIWSCPGRRGKTTGAEVYGQSSGRRLSISESMLLSSGDETYAILSCAYEILMDVGPEKCFSICSDSQAALSAPPAT
jgi:hypothetical protein